MALLLASLPVAAEGSRAGYDRDLFDHWDDTNGSGCDARQDTLFAQVIGFPQVDLFDRCVIVEGDWYSVYDGVTHSGSPSELDVDHVVALAEAWDSGAAAWSPTLRRTFANDSTNLIAVTASSNRSKSDRDVAEWTPPARSSWCLTASITVAVKARYSLTVDPAERDALERMIGTCGDADQVELGDLGSIPVTTIAPVTTTASTAAPTTTPPAETAPPTDSCIDINSASIDELDRIIHVGESRAADIIALRPFGSVSDLTRVSGISDGRLADIVAQGLACVR